MAREIDEQIVQMRFENSQFESEAGKTIDTLHKLRDSTDELGQNGASFDPLISALDKVGGKFSIMETIATGALLRIGYQAEALAERFVKGLSIDQVTAGWSKYEEKTRSVQTIMSATGDSIDEVNQYLSKLMWYTDETSYNFTDMTNNIGKFTAQGVELEDATTAMMGIANWAAEAGQGVNEASRAMYNLSQALGMGKVRLQDWMSIENANMGTKQFKEQVIETAIELGTLTEEAKTAKGELVTFSNFRETLASDWFTSDVLIETLRKYGDYSEEVYKMVKENDILAAEAMDILGESYEGVGKAAFEAAQVSKTFADSIDATKDAVSSGWLITFEHLLGNLETQKVLWTEVTEVLWELFAAGGEARNELLAAWEELGGQAVFLDSIGLILDGILGVMDLIGSAWSRAFPPMTAQTLFDLTVSLRNFLASLELTEYASENIADAIGGVLSVFKAVGQVIFAVIRGFAPGVSTLNDFAGSVVGVAGSIGRALTAFSEMITTEEHLQAVTNTVRTVVGSLSDIFVSLAEALTGADINSDGVVSSFSGVFSSIYEGIKNSLNSSGPLLETFGDIFEKVFGRINDFLSSSSDGEGKATEFLSSLSQAIVNGSEAMSGSVPAISQFIVALGNLIDTITTGLGQLFSNITGTLDWDKIFGLTSLLALVLLLKQINDLNPTAVVGGILNSLKETIDQFKFKLFVESIKALSGAIAILATSITVLGSMPIANALVATGILAAVGYGLQRFIDYLGGLDTTNIQSIKDIAKPLLLIAGTFSILASSLVKIGSLNIPNMIVSVAALGAVMLELQKFMDSIQNIKLDAATVGALNALASAIDLLIVGLRLLAGLSIGETVTGLLALAGIMAEVAVFSNSIQNVNINPVSAVAIIGIASAIDLLAVAVAALGHMNLDSIGKGLLAIGGLLTELAVFSMAMQNVQFSGATVGIIALAAAVDLLVPALVILGGLQLSEIGTALLAVGGALAEMVAAMALLQFVGPQALAGAVGIAALTVAITALVPAITVLGALPVDTIKQGLIAIAAAIGIFVAAAYLLTPISASLVGLSASFALISVGAAALIAAFGLLAGSLTKLAAGFILFGSMSEDTVQQACDNIKIILDELVMWLVGAYVKFKAANLVMFAAFIDALVELAPDIANGVLSILNDILQALVEWGPELFQGLLDLLTVLDDYMEPLGEKAIELMEHFLDGLIKGLKNGISKVVDEIVGAGKRLFNSFKNALFGGGDSAIESMGEEMASDAAKGLSTGAARSEKLASKAGSGTAQAYLDGFDETAKRHSPWETTEERGEEANQGLANGVKKSLFKVTDAAQTSASELLSSLGQALMGNKSGKATADGGAIGEVGSKAGETFASSVEKSGAGTSAAKSIAKQIKEDTSMEDAAKKQAEKVAKAFTTEFNKISSQLSAIGSKFGIAEAYLGPEDDYGKVAKQKELLELQRLQEELQVLGTKYSISWDQYQNMLANPNISNEEAQKQYADYLKIYEELAKKANEVAQKQKDLYGSYEEAEMLVMAELQDLGRAQAELMNSAQIQYSEATQEAYNNFLKASTDEQKQYYYDLWNQLKKTDAENIFGDIIAKPLDADQIRNEVYSQLGLDPNNPIASFMSVEELINQAVSASQQTYLSAVEETYPGIIQAYEAKLADSGDDVLEFVESEVSPKFARSGVAMAESTAKGIDDSAGAVLYSGESMSKEAATHVKSKNSDWKEVGMGMMDGIIEGIEDRKAEVIEAAIQVALNALGAAKNALGIASPSKAFLAVGMFAIDGLRMGILNNKESAVGASTDVANDVLDAFNPLSDDISRILDSSMHPVIDPTVDLTGVRKAVETIDNLWSSETLSAIGDISTSEWNRRAELLDARKPRTPIVENINNFTQNNYSPKALSDAEIYLQTKKELNWVFKGAQQ